MHSPWKSGHVYTNTTHIFACFAKFERTEIISYALMLFVNRDRTIFVVLLFSQSKIVTYRDIRDRLIQVNKKGGGEIIFF